MRIMTSNIWGDYFGNPVEVRQDQLYQVFQTYQPDILGFQEVTSGWYNGTLLEKLSEEYAFAGTELYENINYVPLAYKKKYALLAKGYEFLTDTPDISKAITWAVLQDGDRKFAVCNTHFWWKTGPEHDEIRLQNARQLTALMRHLHETHRCCVFAFGDMNCTVSSGVFRIYAENGIRQLRELAVQADTVTSHHGDPLRGEDGLYHGTPSTKDYNYSIDHLVVLGEGCHVDSYRVIEDQAALDATDHSPVFADVEII